MCEFKPGDEVMIIRPDSMHYLEKTKVLGPAAKLPGRFHLETYTVEGPDGLVHNTGCADCLTKAKAAIKAARENR